MLNINAGDRLVYRHDGEEIEVIVTTPPMGCAYGGNRGRLGVFPGLDEAAFWCGVKRGDNGEDLGLVCVEELASLGRS